MKRDDRPLSEKKGSLIFLNPYKSTHIKMLSSEIRSRFISYFQEKGHTGIASASLVPINDPTLLFVNAGMVPFKGMFLGEEKGAYVRAVSSQKCMRAGGKHNDLEQVGKTARHHTFFEMLGNFSFGDYFKKEAIHYAWELVTEIFQLPKERIWITIYQDDNEAEALWRPYCPASRILRLGEKDNFWQMGETGPCGPCSEIMIDQGEAVHPDCPGIGQCDCDRYLEIWNLVFMQYNRNTSQGPLSPLPRQSIDTGMGLERMTAISQGVLSNYQTDLFRPIFGAIAQKIGYSLNETIQMMPARVMADHLRAMTFLISDGVIPSNEGRGYVLRRIIRRAARFSTKLTPDGGCAPCEGGDGIYHLTGSVIDAMRQAYPELEPHRNQIKRIVRMEEEQFAETLTRGGAFLDELIETVQKQGCQTIAGEAVFKLYDTYGFPIDMTVEVAGEAGLSIDEEGYQIAMRAQQERARRSRFIMATPTSTDSSPALLDDAAPTLFTGYAHLTEEVALLHILKGDAFIHSASAGESVDLIFDASPFYGEGGGQVGDQGRLVSAHSEVAILDTQKRNDIFLHRARVISGNISVGEAYHARVDQEARQHTARNHTATHLLHAVLKEILGDHVKQAGSLVAPDRLRFDFYHPTPPSQKEIDAVEARVNEQILQAVSVNTEVMEVKEAMASGAMALFGEKYGDHVRVVAVSDFSRELCGGTHCHNTGQIGLFKIIREGSAASGIRRIEAVTGAVAYQWMKGQEEILRDVSSLFKTEPKEVLEKASRMVMQLKEKDRQIEQFRMTESRPSIQTSSPVQMVGEVPVLVQKINSSDMKAIRLHADRLRDQLKSGIVIVGASHDGGGKASLVVMVTSEWMGRYPASDIAANISMRIGGTGGGKAGMAQGGGGDVERLDAALQESIEMIKALGEKST